MHLNSNGGAFVSRTIGNMLDHRKLEDGDLQLFAERLKLGCQIFDSAPCYLDAKSSFSVIKHLIPNPLIGIPAAMMFAFASIIRDIVSYTTGNSTIGESFWNALLDDTNCNHQAFIYSYKDDICHADKLEKFVHKRRQRGVKVTVKHFEDSKHVQHIRLHEKEYCKFVENVLIDMEEKNKVSY